MNYRIKRLGKNTILVFIGNIGSKMIGFLMLPLYTRWLTVDNYGIADMITIYVSFLFSIVTCCIGESLFIFPKGVEFEKQKYYFSTTFHFLTISSLVLAFIFFPMKIIANTYNIYNSFVDNIWLIYFLLLSYILQQITQQFTRCLDKMSAYSIAGVIYTLFTAIYAFVFIPKYGVTGYVYSLLFANLTSAIYSFVASNSYRYFSIKGYRMSLLKEMLKYSIPLIPNGVMWWLVNALNRPIMEKHLGFHDIGLFAFANKFPGLLTMIATVFFTSWQISVLEEYDKPGFVIYYNKVFRLFVSLLFVVLLFVTLGSKELVKIFATTEYLDSWKYIPLLTISAMFSSVAGFCGTIFSATRESKYFLYSSSIAAISAVVLNVVLIPFLGLLGACVAVMLSFAILGLTRIVYGYKNVKIDYKYQLLFGLFLCTVVVFLYIREFNSKYPIGLSLLIIAYIAYINKDMVNVFKEWRRQCS